MVRRSGIALARVVLERWGLALAGTAAVPNVVAAAADIESSVVGAQSATSCAEHMLQLVRQGGACKMVPARRGLLSTRMSSCLGCSG